MKDGIANSQGEAQGGNDEGRLVERGDGQTVEKPVRVDDYSATRRRDAGAPRKRNLHSY
jgi:hypothetical protein